MKKYTLFLLIAAILSPVLNASILTESKGWIESLYIKWTPDTTLDRYEVYCSGNSIQNVKIENSLIRNYGSYFRADIPGLPAGDYLVKVNGIKNNKIIVSDSVSNLKVISHDRSGYAFWNGRIPGAYTADGTLKPGAVVLYITNQNKNTISMDVTGATTNPCVGLQTILDGFKKGKDNRPLDIRLVGQITDFTYMLGGDLVIENNNNASSYITFEGIGEDAVADGWGLRVKNASNVEVRNLGFMNTNGDEGDNLGLQQNNDYIWAHHCDMFYGNAGSDADQVKGDGALDCKKSTFITFSYNHFWDNGKCNLLGLSEGTTEGLFITYHHNWYDHSDSRHPRVRYYSAHVYNNYYDGNANYGVGSTLGSSVFVESNYFRNCKYPIMTSMQGTDVWNEATQKNDYVNMPTFSNEDGGSIKAFNNYMTGQKRFVAYGATGFANSIVDFDAFVVAQRSDTIPASVKSVYGGNTYNNFDTSPLKMYSYTADSPETAREKVVSYAGRTNGGDFKWVFTNAVDDASSSVNTALKTALTNYKTTLVSVQGDTVVTVENPGGGDTTVVVNNPDYIQNFTASGKTSNFYSITGNLSSSYGTVAYNDLTLTQCLKMESSTLISFTTDHIGTLNLIFNSAYSGSVKIDGIAYTPINGSISVELQPGSHTVQKGSGSSYLFYMFMNFITSLSNSENQLFYFDSKDSVFVSKMRFDRLSVFDISGRFITKFDYLETIHLTFLPKNTYLLQIQTPTKTYQSKILKN